MKNDKAKWVAWLKTYGADKFYDAFVRIAQGARSRCVFCGQYIFLDIVEGGGIPDWKTASGDYGCDQSPETCLEGCGSHKAQKGE